MPLETKLPQRATDRRWPPPPAGLGSTPPWTSENLATRILIIEDEVMIAWMIESILEDEGFTDIVIAADAAEARRLATGAAVGVIVSDVNLGKGENGIAASVAICRDVPAHVIFVTAYADPATRRHIQSSLPGATLLRKPVDGRALIEAVRRSLLPNQRN